MQLTPGPSRAGGDTPVETGREDFAELSRRVRLAGLMTRRSGYYGVKIAATVAALTVVLVAGVALGNSWWNLLTAIALAFVMAQIGFIGHDAGHRQVSRDRRRNDAIGLVLANLLTGFSFNWWLAKHSRHHAHTNQLGKDPDIAAGALVYSREQLLERERTGRWFARLQSVFLVPLLFLEALNLHLSSVVAVLRRRDRAALVEGGLLAVHATVFLVGPFLVLDPIRAMAFICISQSLLGFYLGATFLTNHVGMPTFGGSENLGFLRQQVLTSRNLRGRRFTGFIFGGLDTQIEHHLFPSMPRANLRRAREIVRPFCAERLIEYAEVSPWGAYRSVFRHLHETGAAVHPAVG